MAVGAPAFFRTSSYAGPIRDDELALSVGRQPLDRKLTFERRAAIVSGFRINEFHRTAMARVFGGCAIVVLVDTALKFRRDTCIQGAVRAFDDVNRPFWAVDNVVGVSIN